MSGPINNRKRPSVPFETRARPVTILPWIALALLVALAIALTRPF